MCTSRSIKICSRLINLNQQNSCRFVGIFHCFYIFLMNILICKSPQNMCSYIFDVYTFFLSPHRLLNKCEIVHKITHVSRVYLIPMTIFTPRRKRGYRNTPFFGRGGKTVQWLLTKTEHI